MSLDVFLKGRRIGALYPGREGALYPSGSDEYRFAYSLDIVEEVEAGTPLLSCSLPVRSAPYSFAETRPYIEGLLPEGERRAQIADDLGIHDPANGYAMISALGRDCPGAVVFLPKGRPFEAPKPEEIAWLDEDELEELLGEAEPEWLCDPEDELRMRFTLPGERHKVALYYDELEDRWAWPEPGLPSTHIVKPQSDELADFAVNEVACTMALRDLGLPVAHAEVRTIAGRPCLVSRRFDRWGEGLDVERLHQESFAQALGYAPEDAGGNGPGHAEACALLAALDEEDCVESLFVASYCRFLLGSRDAAHGRNSALLHSRTGPMLAPFYDLVSDSVYEDPHEKHPLPEAISRNSALVALAPIAIECGYAPEPALIMGIQTTADLHRALNDVAERAREEGWYAPVIDDVMTRVLGCATSFREEVELLKPPGAGGAAAGRDAP